MEKDAGREGRESTCLDVAPHGQLGDLAVEAEIVEQHGYERSTWPNDDILQHKQLHQLQKICPILHPQIGAYTAPKHQLALTVGFALTLCSGKNQRWGREPLRA